MHGYIESSSLEVFIATFLYDTLAYWSGEELEQFISCSVSVDIGADSCEDFRGVWIGIVSDVLLCHRYAINPYCLCASIAYDDTIIIERRKTYSLFIRHKLKVGRQHELPNIH